MKTDGVNSQNHKETILAVDDDPALLKMMARYLEHWGYRALTATNGEDGLDLAEKEHPDLILLDILMPTLKGREVCRQLKENPRTKDISIIFLTALRMPEHIREGLNLGADDYIVKPFEPEDLQNRIWVCLMHRKREKPS